LKENKLLEFCVTEAERQNVAAVLEHGTNRKAAEVLGKACSTVGESIKRVRDRAALQGFAPEHDMTKTAPDTHFVKGTSTLYGENGEIKVQWIKTEKKLEDQYKVMKEIAESLSDAIPVVEKRDFDGQCSEDTLTVYPLGDPHIGMLAWGEECGMDWDLKIAEEKYGAVFSSLCNASPASKEALIINLGDYFHADNLAGVTSRSGHSLDMDGRYAKMVRVGVRILRGMVEKALDKHEKVRVINVTGNHDDVSSMFLSVAMSEMYRNEPRVTVDDSPTAFHYYRFGSNLIGTHHGHSTKMDKLPLLMATDKSKDWGETKHRYWYTGHIHHDSKKEFSGCVVESFRTLAAKDSYAHWHGYRAAQDMKSIVIHKNYGEVARHTVNLMMV
jgi:hypothetical protein